MARVGVRELKQNTSLVLRRVRDQKERIQITHRGVVIALLVPVAAGRSAAQEKRDQAAWTDLDALAAEIGAHWPTGVSAVDAIRQDRTRP